MPSRDFVVVILAAGKGTRLQSSQAKVLHRAGGRPLAEHVLRACRPLGARELIVVVGYQADQVGALAKSLGAKAVVQQPQLGTGHALQVARRAAGSAPYALVLPGDAPLVRTHTLQALLRAHQQSGAAATLLTAVLDDPAGYGRIVRKNDGSVAAIVEEKALGDEHRQIREINSGIYVFTLAKLWPALAQVRPNNAHRELYLTDTISVLNQQGEKVFAEVVADAHEVLGCNTRAELAEVDRLFRQRKRAAVMAAGATLYLPDTILIDPEVEIGPDTVIEPGVQLLGRTKIGARGHVRAGAVLVDAVLDDDVTVEPHCVVVSSRLESRVVIGPFARLRPGNRLRPGSRIGNFVEMKKSDLGEGAKAMHLTYLGDATVGRDTNVGAGTITCNYDGIRKYRTTIGKRVFVGSGTELVAPVRVGDGAYIAAGSTVTENVPADALAVARGRQVNKPGWARQRRAEVAAANPKSKRKSKPHAKRPSRRPSKRSRPKPARRRKPPARARRHSRRRKPGRPGSRKPASRRRRA